MRMEGGGILPWGTLIVCTERLVEIAGIAVAQHIGDFLHGQFCCFQQAGRPFHPLFQEDLGELFPGFLPEQAIISCTSPDPPFPFRTEPRIPGIPPE